MKLQNTLKQFLKIRFRFQKNKYQCKKSYCHAAYAKKKKLSGCISAVAFPPTLTGADDER